VLTGADRLRGYQFKTTAGPRKNPKVYGKFGGDKKEQLADATPPPDVDAAELENSGFAERVKEE
jgi:hypothetical protein